jgi:hypothetical protein
MNTKEMQPIHFLAQTIGNNHDILTDLLLLIPAKPFLKFKSVSKTICDFWPWILPLSNTAAPPLLKDTTKGSLLDYLDVPRIKIEYFCNGLLLCSSAYLLKPMEQIKKKSGAGGVSHASCKSCRLL